MIKIVHITQGDYDGSAVIISWVTMEEPGDSKVSYGTSQDNYKNQAVGNFTSYTFYGYKSGYIHHCLVEGLEFNTKYYYKIGSGDSAREFWFQTPPAVNPDAAYTFGIIGDLGQTYNSLSTLDHYIGNGGQAVLFVGDLSYADRYDHDNGVRWDSWGRFVERSAAYQPWIWTAGNHEIEYMPNVKGGATTYLWVRQSRAGHVLGFVSTKPTGPRSWDTGEWPPRGLMMPPWARLRFLGAGLRDGAFPHHQSPTGCLFAFRAEQDVAHNQGNVSSRTFLH
ncbi:hypothetical protein ACLOJK_027668 [Asimina triloba]